MPYENGKPVDDFKPATYTEPAKPFVDAVRNDRVGRYLALGFTEMQSELLADTKDSSLVGGRRYSAALHHGKVARMLDQGATHDQVVAIYA